MPIHNDECMAELSQEIAKVRPDVGRVTGLKINRAVTSRISGKIAQRSLQIYCGHCPHWHFKFPIDFLGDLTEI